MLLQEIPLAHSFNEGQIEWFKAGSALNLVCSSYMSQTSLSDHVGNLDGCQGQAINGDRWKEHVSRPGLVPRNSVIASLAWRYFLGYLYHSAKTSLFITFTVITVTTNHKHFI